MRDAVMIALVVGGTTLGALAAHVLGADEAYKSGFAAGVLAMSVSWIVAMVVDDILDAQEYKCRDKSDAGGEKRKR